MTILTGIKSIFQGLFGKTVTELHTVTAPQEPQQVATTLRETYPYPTSGMPNNLAETALKPAQAVNVDIPTQKENKQLVEAVAIDFPSSTIEQFALTFFKGSSMNFIAIITVLIQSIKAIELLMPASTGKEKLDAVIATVEGVFGSVQAILPQLTALAGVLVAGFNAIGLFVKKPVIAA